LAARTPAALTHPASRGWPADTTATCAAWTYHPTASYTCVLHSAVTPVKSVKGATSGVASGRPGPIPPRACIGAYAGCYKDCIPAPGVPPVRAVDVLVAGPTTNMSVAGCAAQCYSAGYTLSGVTSGGLAHARGGEPTTAMYSCFCGCSANAAAPALPNATCAAPCAGAPSGDGPCGGSGAMALYAVECTPWPGLPPPTSKCGGGGNGSHPLPPGPACSQPQSKKWKFCDTTVPLDDRVNDLVDRIMMVEAGPLLTARESPAIPRLGIPAFYWGTNAVHGVDWGNATTFPEGLNMGCESALLFYPPRWATLQRASGPSVHAISEPHALAGVERAAERGYMDMPMHRPLDPHTLAGLPSSGLDSHSRVPSCRVQEETWCHAHAVGSSFDRVRNGRPQLGSRLTRPSGSPALWVQVRGTALRCGGLAG
jgi:hypothetical protein